MTRLSICFVVESVEFTADVIAGTASLGGSESACLGLARALQARGHRVHIFTMKLGADAPQVDHAGVTWHPTSDLEAISIFADWDLLVALRMPAALGAVPAKFKVLWAQDLMSNEQMRQHVMGLAWAFDRVAYVSAYHRHQWEGVIPELKPIGYVTRNGFDQTLVPTAVTKRTNRIIHISRPERGLEPILQMWPALKAAEPDAELALCRYSSMYDAQGWGKVCEGFDQMVAHVNEQVGGITYLGELGKPALYKAIAESAVMWYPGVSTFAETSCIAAIESQACGTPFVGSWKGALPETVPTGVLIHGVAEGDPAYHADSIQAVRYALEGCRKQTFGYRQVQQQGRKHVEAYTYAAIAAEWEAWILEAFLTRYETQKAGVLARLMYEDDCTRAIVVADDILAADPTHAQAQASKAMAQRIIAGLEHTATDYAEHALSPSVEIAARGPRAEAVLSLCAGAKRIIDLACGNGAFAILLAQADPERHITAVDFSPANVAAAKAEADSLGLTDRITWTVAPVWDMAAQQPSAWLSAFLETHQGAFDGLWCGEFIEHVADCRALVEAVEPLVAQGGVCVWSCPYGPVGSLAPRGEADKRSHAHHFHPADLYALFSGKRDFDIGIVPWQIAATRSAEPVGNRIISYRRDAARPTGTIDDWPQIHRTRPYAAVTAGIISNSTIDLRRCLVEVWPVVDEIVIGDTGCAPGELARIAEEFPRKTRIVPVGSVMSLRGGFSEARNRVLAEATGDWFLWIDSDEVLCGIRDLAKYRDSILYQGYAIAQQHLQIDMARHADLPVRMFRKRTDIQFYGCVHEQPQMGDCNGDVVPCLQINDVQIAHTGYLHESIRRDKALHRNFPLLVRDQQVFPERALGKLLVLRDYANLALWSREQSRGALSPAVKKYEALVIGLFEEHFMDPANKYHRTARPFYESALRDIEGAMEVEIGITGALSPVGLNGTRTTADRVWVRTAAHLRALLTNRMNAMLTPLEQPPALDVEPLSVVTPVPVVELSRESEALV